MSKNTVNRIKAFFVKAIKNIIFTIAICVVGIAPLVIGWCSL